MNPNDNLPKPTNAPSRRQQFIEYAQQSRRVSEAAAGVVRHQIDTIYNNAAAKAETKPQNTSQQSASDLDTAARPYDRTHQEVHKTAPDQWEKYHTAWQDYYQKYYERYYLGQVYQARNALEDHIKKVGPTQPVAPVATAAAQVWTAQSAPPSPLPSTILVSKQRSGFNREEVISDLKQSLLNKVKKSAQTVRRSNHFVPLMAAAGVTILFLFLQYNRVFLATVEAYVRPGTVNPANIIISTNEDIPVGQESRLIIPKINVDVPIRFDAKPDNASQLKAMESGVAYFGIPGANSLPGQVGNTPIAGHSSNDLIDRGDYKFIFARLEQLELDDTFFIHYGGKRYTYTLTQKEVVRPSQVDKLIYPTDKPVVTLITCVPVGTARDRLLVTAEQISPSPSIARPAPPKPDTSAPTAKMPGNSPTFLQRLFGG